MYLSFPCVISKLNGDFSVLQNKQRLIATGLQLVLACRFNVAEINVLPDELDFCPLV